MTAIANDPVALALVASMARGESDLTHLKDRATNLPLAIDGNLVLKAHDHAVKHGIGLPVQQVDLTSGGQPIQVFNGPDLGRKGG